MRFENSLCQGELNQMERSFDQVIHRRIGEIRRDFHLRILPMMAWLLHVRRKRKAPGKGRSRGETEQGDLF